MKRVYGIVLLLLLGGLVSCSTDFDINAPQKDITVVFGLMSSNDTTHYIKITRAFIGEDDALVMAQDPALSDYGDILTVQVEEHRNGSINHTYNCTRTLITNKDTGTFYSHDQYVYAFDAILNVEATYVLKITNNETGSECTAETGLVKSFTITKPYYNPVNPIFSFVNSSGLYAEGEVKWTSAKNGRLYEPLFRFNYREVTVGTTDTVDKYIDWKLTSVKSSNLDGGEELMVTYSAEAFYRYLEAMIPVDYNKKRLIGKIDLYLSVGGDDLSTYLDLNKPSNSIIQERPAFTNVSNGIGIFSCRYTRKISFALSSFSVAALINGEYTNQLGFQ